MTNTLNYLLFNRLPLLHSSERMIIPFDHTTVGYSIDNIEYFANMYFDLSILTFLCLYYALSFVFIFSNARKYIYYLIYNCLD